MASSAEPLFAADSIGKSFGRRRVLKAASVWAWPGTFTLLMGRNGSGKTTLLRAAVGLTRADHGVVRYRGRVRRRPRLPSLAREGLFYLPSRGLLPRRGRVREHLDAVAWRYDARAGADDAVARLEVGDLLDALTEEISGGERRRVEVALAMARGPACLLADEPFAGIGPADAEVVSAALEHVADRGAAVVITGHEVPPLMDLADEVVWLVAGATHGLGGSEQAMTHEQFRREYLGPGRAPA